MHGGALFWMGPVSAANLSRVALPPGWKVVPISAEAVAPGRPLAEGLTPSDFRAFGAALGPRPLATLLGRAGADVSALAAFSAGGALLEILVGDRSAPAPVAVLSADAYYGLAVQPNLLAYGRAAVEGRGRLWLTTSSAKGGVTIHSGSESVAPFSDALGLQRRDRVPVFVVDGVEKARARNRVLWLDYAGHVAHVDHARRLAPAILSGWSEAGWLAAGGGPNGPSADIPLPLLLAGLRGLLWALDA